MIYVYSMMLSTMYEDKTKPLEQETIKPEFLETSDQQYGKGSDTLDADIALRNLKNKWRNPLLLIWT